VAIWHGRQAIFTPTADQEVQADDMLLLVGSEDRVSQLTGQGVTIGRNGGNGYISTRGVSLIEVVLAPHAQSQDQTLQDLEFRKRYGFTAVALRRGGHSYRSGVGNIPLQLGDSILMVGPYSRIRELRNNSDFIVLEPDPRDQPVQLNHALLAISVVLGAVILSAFGFPDYLAILAGALLLVVLGVISMEEAYRAVEWQAIFLIAGMYAVSRAMVATGLADLVGERVVGLLTPFGPLGLAAGAYLLTSALTQVMGGQVATLVTGPILISAAISAHTSPQAIAVAAAIGCSVSFFTPIAHPVNILMIGPANYTFSDFFRVGWLLTIVCFVMLLVGMVLFWGL
jgi:di/tricarboxylate transporter